MYYCSIICMKKTTLLSLLFLFTLAKLTYAQDYLDEGLYFASHEVTKEKRTSLNLTPNTPIQLKNKFSIEFEANFRRGDGYYGNIIKIIANNRLNIDLVANLDSEQENFWLVIKDKVLFKYKWSDIPKGDYDKWIKFNLEIDVENSKITMTINGDKIVKTSSQITEVSDFDIIFGKSLNNKFSTTDVCPMSIKNIKIINKNGKLLRNWTLGKHSLTNKVYDNIIKDEAIVDNPKWLIDEHVFWKKNKNFEFINLLGTAKEVEAERLFFIDSKAVYVYHLAKSTMDTFAYKKHTFQCQSNTFVYSKLKKELIAYSIDENTYSTFDFEKSKWSNSDNKCPETGYLHHNKMISPRDSTLLTFGGYGYYRYNSLIKKIIPNSSDLKPYDLGNEISPRYLSSLGVLNSDEFLIFGGYGSRSGKQGVNSQFYYDLYSVQFKDFKVKKLWTADNLYSSPFVPVQSMVIDNNSDSFYTLTYDNTTYNTNLKLARFGINEQSMAIFPDSIPYQFLDIKSQADFFLDQNKTKLFTLTRIEDKVSLFSLTYPPLFAEDIYQDVRIENSTFNYKWILLLIGCIIAGIAIFKTRKRKRDSIKAHTNTSINEEILEFAHTKSKKLKKSAVYLFGGFQVYDCEGNDVTALFTPTIKELFLMILLSSKENDKGISSKKLTELLWPNKSENNARNNRNVNISKLRLLLDKIGDIGICNENTYWQINIGKSVFCDYSFVINKLTKSIHKNIEKEEIYELLNIVSRGEISPDIQTDCIEDFKTEISNLLIDDLNRISKTQNDLHLLILISNAILKYGPLNEEAISLKCKSLYALGKKGLAKQGYNQFCKVYSELLDTNYDITFKEIIGE